MSENATPAGYKSILKKGNCVSVIKRINKRVVFQIGGSDSDSSDGDEVQTFKRIVAYDTIHEDISSSSSSEEEDKKESSTDKDDTNEPDDNAEETAEPAPTADELDEEQVELEEPVEVVPVGDLTVSEISVQIKQSLARMAIEGTYPGRRHSNSFQLESHQAAFSEARVGLDALYVKKALTVKYLKGHLPEEFKDPSSAMGSILELDDGEPEEDKSK